MNERIRELEKQATTVVEGWSDECGTTRYYEFDRRKFAELIIQECQFAIVSRTDLPKHERKLYNNVLKEHFGIEK